MQKDMEIKELVLLEKYEEAYSKIKMEEKDFSIEDYILRAIVCREIGKYDEMYLWIKKGIKLEPDNSELFLLLGNYFERINSFKAYLCYENALLYAKDQEEIDITTPFLNRLKMEFTDIPNKVSIVILSYNTLEMLKMCIQSIRAFNYIHSYEIVVVDNASTDGSVEWLKHQKDLKVILNQKNEGFPVGCNQGIKIAEPDNDIFLLNSDTLLFENSLFWLRMGLYEENNVGSTGSITNHAGNEQMIGTSFLDLDEYYSFARENNILMDHPYEPKFYLIGFALLIKRCALDEIGLLDRRFTPGQFEDNDFGLRLYCNGWKNLLCHNSFIFHYGHGGGQASEFWRLRYVKNAEILKEKIGFDMTYYTHARHEMVSLIGHNNLDSFRVLEVGCGLGATLHRIKYEFPNAETFGIEIVHKVAELGNKQLNIIEGNIENMKMPYEEGYFDYIILADVLEHLHDPKETLILLKKYLKRDGYFLCSIPNIMHMSVMQSLLMGKFNYEDAGILDRTHLKFFTLDSIYQMFTECDMSIENMAFTLDTVNESEERKELLKVLMNYEKLAPIEQFSAYQYIFKARV